LNSQSQGSRVYLFLLTIVVLGAIAPRADANSSLGRRQVIEPMDRRSGTVEGRGRRDHRLHRQPEDLAELVLGADKTYKNFVLKAQFRRSKATRGFNSVASSTMAIASPAIRPTSILYEEGGRGVLAKANAREAGAHFKKDNRNEYVITIQGSKIKQEMVTSPSNPKSKKERVPPQESPYNSTPAPQMEIRFKDIAIRELGPE
jgi:hypothetical protein